MSDLADLFKGDFTGPAKVHWGTNNPSYCTLCGQKLRHTNKESEGRIPRKRRRSQPPASWWPGTWGPNSGRTARSSCPPPPPAQGSSPTRGCGPRHTGSYNKGFPLKGQYHEIFDFRFFSWIIFPQSSDYPGSAFPHSFKNSWRYLQRSWFVIAHSGLWSPPHGIL
jgi:hypothetical protein